MEQFTRLEKLITLSGEEYSNKVSITEEVILDIFDTLSSYWVDKIKVWVAKFAKTQLEYDYVIDRDFINQIQIDRFFKEDNLIWEGVNYWHYSELAQLLSTKIVHLKSTQFIIEYQWETCEFIWFRVRAHYPWGYIWIIWDILPPWVKIWNIAFFDILASKTQNSKPFKETLNNHQSWSW